MSSLGTLPSSTDPTPEDGEPPSPETMRSWAANWTTEPFAEDTEYAQGLRTLSLLVERTAEDVRHDEKALALAALSRARTEEEYFKPITEPQSKTVPQRLGELARRLIRRGSP